MRFAYGQPHILVEAGWFLIIDSIENPHKDFVRTRIENDALTPVSCHSIVGSNIMDTMLRKLASIAFAMNLSRHLPIRQGWYMNRNGGMCARLHNILKVIESNDFPEEVINPETVVSEASIKQWPGGNHFYAKLSDGRSVEVDGVYKWDTWDQARAAVEQFVGLKNLTI